MRKMLRGIIAFATLLEFMAAVTVVLIGETVRLGYYLILWPFRPARMQKREYDSRTYTELHS